MKEINSVEYWNDRFSTNSWISNNGIKQSEFFADLIIKNIQPRILYETTSMLDFGCALGQLCNKWEYISGTKDIAGYDFSSIACKKAKELYPTILFSDVVPKRKFDVVVSSNLLEHVENFIGYLHRFTNIAEKYVVILVPFESGIGGEHINEFDEKSFPEEINGFVKIQEKIIQCKSPGIWEHKQLLIVYKAY